MLEHVIPCELFIKECFFLEKLGNKNWIISISSCSASKQTGAVSAVASNAVFAIFFNCLVSQKYYNVTNHSCTSYQCTVFACKCNGEDMAKLLWFSDRCSPLLVWEIKGQMYSVPDLKKMHQGPCLVLSNSAHI